MREQDSVEYVGDDDGVLRIYRGHPGRVVDTGLWPNEVAVAFVNGPSLYLAAGEARILPELDYLTRGRRLVALTHPLEDRPVPRFNADGEEWPEGHEPIS